MKPQKKKNALLLIICLGLLSCQSPEEKAVEARRKAHEAAIAEEEKQIKTLVDTTPDLYRVFWKVCGDKTINLNRDINGGCDEARQPVTQGFREPMLMWGKVSQIKIEEDTRYRTTGISNPVIFIKSRGCLIEGAPKEENFYKLREFSVEKNKPVTADNIRFERLSRQEKESQIRQQVAILDATRGVPAFGIMGVRVCESFDDWKNSNTQS
jgi:hypothetical protein